ncbi:hypothetical protein AWC27_06645 [Mycobacterium szulgai]|uniref:Uncharacterized protein n=1 Tax=Mycobacterium szulgai TaxID=1787 RepID=A0A1X2E4X8_MYCSZ|nr:hypothetical protein AWC27_06645 [Mycobacterium szulgai]
MAWRAVKTMPVSVSTEAGRPWAAKASRKQSRTAMAVNTGRAVQVRALREWSSMMSRISMGVPGVVVVSGLARCQWVMSACQHSLGCSAWKRM